MGKEKKEIGKLIELLNEYEQEEGCWRLKYGKLHNKYYDDYDQKDEEIRLISKWYGFVKWLVENEKIAYDIPNNSDLYRAFELACIPLDNADYITMLLSIQDEPIEFLISILK